jgi:hypothetical protein
MVACGVTFISPELDEVVHYFAIENLNKYGITWTQDLIEINDEVIVGIHRSPYLEAQELIRESWKSGEVRILEETEETVEELKQRMIQRHGFKGELPYTVENTTGTIIPFAYGSLIARLP